MSRKKKQGMDLTKEYEKILKKPNHNKLDTHSYTGKRAQIQEGIAGHLDSVITTSDQRDTDGGTGLHGTSQGYVYADESATMGADYWAVGRNEIFPWSADAEPIRAHISQTQYAEEIIGNFESYTTNLRGIDTLTLADNITRQLNVEGDGCIVTRNNQGEEVVRIDSEGIHVNGTLIIGIPSSQESVNIPDEESQVVSDTLNDTLRKTRRISP